MSATARESKTRFPLLVRWPLRLDIAPSKVLTNVSPTARPARSEREPLISLSTQVISRSAAATTLFFCLTLFPSFCSAAPEPPQQPLGDPSGPNNLTASPEPSL